MTKIHAYVTDEKAKPLSPFAMKDVNKSPNHLRAGKVRFRIVR